MLTLQKNASTFGYSRINFLYQGVANLSQLNFLNINAATRVGSGTGVLYELED
jgi:hypothetical protein